MAETKLKAHKCPVCSAPLDVPSASALSLTCRYCGSVIAVEHRKPTRAESRAVSQPGRPPTLYVHTGTGTAPGCFVIAIIVVTVVLPLGAAFGGGCIRSITRAVKPFPATCAVNEEMHLRGSNWSGSGPAISAATNCKIFVEGGKFAGDTFLGGTGSNIELHLKNVEIVVTGTAIQADYNVKIYAQNSKIEAGGYAIKTTGNVTLQLEGGSVSGAKAALMLGDNAKLEVTGTTVSSKEDAIALGSNGKVSFHDAKITAGDVALGATSSLTLDVEGGTISGKGAAVRAESNSKLRFKGGDVRSEAVAIDASRGSLELQADGTKFTATDSVVSAKGNSKVRIAKKSELRARDVLVMETNSEIVCDDAIVEATGSAVRVDVNANVKLSRGCKVSGKRRGIDGATNLNVSVDNAAVTSDGIAIRGVSNGRLTFNHASVRGTEAALSFTGRLSALEEVDSQVVGPRKLAK